MRDLSRLPDLIVVDDLDDKRVLTDADFQRFIDFCNRDTTQEQQEWIAHKEKEYQRIMNLNKKHTGQ